MTGPSEESAPGHAEPAAAPQQPEAPGSLFADDRTDSHPHPETSGAFDVQPTQAVAPPPNPAASGPHQVPNPAVSGPHQVPQSPPTQYGYDQNLPPLQPQYGDPAQQYQAQAQYPQQQPQQQPSGLPQPQGGRHAAPQPQGGHGHDLSTAHLVKQVKRPPQSGWRKAVYVGTGKLVNPGESPADTQRRDLIARVNQPLRGCYKIAMLSLKGGVGKTTVTTTLGATFASLRGDRVVAVDANPDRGTLSQKIPLETTATVRHLLRDAARITRYSDVRSYTSQGASRLEILASEQDPAVSEAFSEDDYRRTVNLLEHFYNIVLTDCGTGLMHSAMKGVLDVADALVVVSSGSVDGARSASATLDWLEAHGYGELVKRSVAVINSVRPKGGSVDLDKLSAHFGAKVRAVCQVPFDPHLEEGAEIELDRLGGDTRLALLDLAATVADGFATPLSQQYR
ncbi:MinD/ParA family protein [Amycolatopsis sp. WQ 127309]|uniref:MinD/ParA family ATP-binding protein n=1 Tax=Amycolatopsis sp. WQ 127309 TaxID=2932773 RepID=UPI001FF45027|nr:MinD/ParA family protein [Amycolatopsis sp. WQ 127309]UOZ09501.1 MinD/ParA family protein [Amycolatopsis sp. WQ 127309]